MLIFAGCSDVPEKKTPINVAKGITKKKVLFVNSYHKGYDWSDSIVNVVMESFGIIKERDGSLDQSNSKVTLKVIYLDTKRKHTEENMKYAALKAKKIIDVWQPDLVITSDDNAAKYLVVPYFMDKSIPFVFCGVNWDASEYGFPCANVTGMIEVQLIDQIVSIMKKYAHGNRIAFIKGDDPSARKEAYFFEKRFNIKLGKMFVKSFSEWKKEYLILQKEYDMVLLGNAASIPDWNPEKAKEIVLSGTKVPTGNWDSWMAPYSLITLATNPAEQGKWAAEKALEILAGKKPGQIPVVKNRRAKIYLNMHLAKQLNIVFPMELIEQAIFVGEE
jgi:ABC-type uncharacterized transport system substrate-binding protein